MPNDRERKAIRAQAEKRKRIIAKNKANYYAAERKSIEKQLKKLLRDVRGKGIYEPKADELTRYRKSRLRKISQTFGDVFNPKEYVFIAAPKKDRKKIIERASNLKITTTNTGLFVAKSGNKKVSLGYSRKYKEYYIKKSGKTKWGMNQGRTYSSIIPLASVDELETEIDRLTKMAEKLGSLKKGERLAYIVEESGIEGYSHKTFNNLPALLRKLEEYQKTTAARLQFFRHITIVKTVSVKKWFEEHPVQEPKGFSRSIYTKMSPSGRRIN